MRRKLVCVLGWLPGVLGLTLVGAEDSQDFRFGPAAEPNGYYKSNLPEHPLSLDFGPAAEPNGGSESGWFESA